MSGKVNAPSQPSTTSAVVTLPDIYGRTLVRSFVTPVQPNSSFQQASQAYFSSVSEAYQSLSQPQVEEWQELANQIERSGRLGLDYNLSWTTLFQQVNNYRLRRNEVITLTPPSISFVNGPSAISQVTTTDESPEQEVSVIIPASSLTVGSFMAIRMTRDLGSPNRQARSNELRYVGTDEDWIIPVTTTGQTSFTAQATRLNIVSGTFIGVEIKVLNPDFVLVGRIFNTNIQPTAI
jgi:hypothetical protein